LRQPREPEGAIFGKDRTEEAGTGDINGEAETLEILEYEAAGRDGAGTNHCALEKLVVELSLKVRIYSLRLLYVRRGWEECSAFGGTRGDSSLEKCSIPARYIRIG
jgi:hypothetical protein